jgi:hypothetical protein
MHRKPECRVNGGSIDVESRNTCWCHANDAVAKLKVFKKMADSLDDVRFARPTFPTNKETEGVIRLGGRVKCLVQVTQEFVSYKFCGQSLFAIQVKGSQYVVKSWSF